MAYISKFTGAQIDDLLEKSKTMGATVDGLAQDVAVKEDAANKVKSITASADDTHYPSTKAVKDAIDAVATKLAASGSAAKDQFSFVKLRVAQYNIGGFGNGDSGTHITPEEADAKALEYRKFFDKNAHADIFCVSEYNSKFHTGNESESNNPRLYCFPNYREWNVSPDYTYYCNAQFYNLPYPIVDKFIVDEGSNMRVVSVAQINGEKVYIINCHLPFDSQPNPQPPTGDNLAAFESLLNFCKDLEFVILCGDFNARDDSYYDMFKNAGFEMANSGILGLLQTEPDYTITHSTGHVDNIMVKGFTINNIWLEPLVHDEIKNREKTESGLSDHCLLCAEIVMQNPIANIVNFYDKAVKSVLLSHFDANNDGEITYNEMRAITDVSTYFQNNTEIKDTRDLVYAKIAKLKGSFKGCANVENIIIPGSAAYCSAITDMSSVKSIFILQPLFAPQNILVESIWRLPNLEIIDFPERCYRINGYALFLEMKSFNVVLRKKDNIVEITSSDLTVVPKNVFVPESLISAYEAASRYAAWVGKFKAIGGEDWINEFGSSNEFADYIKYGLEGYISM